MNQPTDNKPLWRWLLLPLSPIVIPIAFTIALAGELVFLLEILAVNRALRKDKEGCIHHDTCPVEIAEYEIIDRALFTYSQKINLIFCEHCDSFSVLIQNFSRDGNLVHFQRSKWIAGKPEDIDKEKP
ncbi:MAG: hypothetical protein PHD68_02245 [Rugosibacter sp.]|nr:hypothetical protein [Rugosibacter sp.]